MLFLDGFYLKSEWRNNIITLMFPNEWRTAKKNWLERDRTYHKNKPTLVCSNFCWLVDHRNLPANFILPGWPDSNWSSFKPHGLFANKKLKKSYNQKLIPYFSPKIEQKISKKKLFCHNLFKFICYKYGRSQYSFLI